MTAALPILAAQHWPGVLNLDVSNLAPPGASGSSACGSSSPRAGEPGLASPDEPLTLARIRVDRGDGAAGLAHKLAQAGLTIGSTSRSLRPGPTRGNARALRP